MLDAPETIELDAERIEYLEVTPSEIGLANRLAGWALGRSIDELAAPTRRLLVELYDWVRGEAARERLAVSYRIPILRWVLETAPYWRCSIRPAFAAVKCVR